MQFVIIAHDGTDENALERRLSVREKHLARGDQRRSAGKTHFGTALLDDSGKMVGSLIICEFETRQDLDAWLAEEPYVTNKVWQQIEIKGCNVGQSLRGYLKV
jgi:uncharacterized protein YciI